MNPTTNLYKYPLKKASFQEIEVPINFKPVSVECINNELYLYAIVNDSQTALKKKLKLHFIGTGRPFPACALVKIGITRFRGVKLNQTAETEIVGIFCYEL